LRYVNSINNEQIDIKSIMYICHYCHANTTKWFTGLQNTRDIKETAKYVKEHFEDTKGGNQKP